MKWGSINIIGRGNASLVARCIIISLLACVGCGKRDIYRETRVMMGTAVEISVAASDERRGRAAIDAAFHEIDRIDKAMSWVAPESELASLNALAATEKIPVSKELWIVIREALSVAASSGGAFDPTVGPLVKLWDFDHGGTVPSGQAIARELRKVGYRNVTIDDNGRRVGFALNGMALDLGGIAKGHAIDAACRRLRDLGISSAIVDAGGDLGVIGSRPDGAAWRIGIQDPRDETRLLRSLELRGTAVATSGDYQRFVIADGVRFHHILDPATGWPARRSRSVTVVAPTAIEADACATAAFVLGPARGLAFLRSRPGVRGLIVDAEGGLHWTDAGLEEESRR